MREYRIAAIGGDGIGPEVIEAGLQALDALATADGGFKIAVERFPWSSDYYLEHGHYIPDGGLDRLKSFDAHGSCGRSKTMSFKLNGVPRLAIPVEQEGDFG